jgi:DNA topoisomerase-3
MKMTNLYICEKKSVGMALSDVLPGVRMKDANFIRRGDDIVAWASGHLLELCEPEDYDPAYKKWSRETALYVPDKWRLKEKERTKTLLSGLKKLIQGLKGSDVVVNVGDGDREGQTLIDEILEYCGWKGQTKRLRLNDVNPDAIRRALDNMKDNSVYRGEYMAGQARMRVDWVCGLALTRFVTVSLRDAGYDAGVLSVGRVQTPTLGLVVERNREIREFVSSPYFDVRAALTLEGGRTVTGRWAPGDSCSARLDAEGRLVNREAAAKLEEKLRGARGVVSKADKRALKTPPPLPYSLTKLQMAASRKYDITDTLVHVQKLYESAYVTYPRTSCEYIPEGHFAEAAKIIDAIRISCPSLSDMLGGADPSRKSAAWDTSKISEHHAIIPTARVPLGSLSETERKIYELICARYVIQFLPDCEYEETTVEFESQGETREKFRAAGRTVINPGWQGWEKPDAQGEGNGEKDAGAGVLPSVMRGETGMLMPCVSEKTTSPPKPYTYHSLLAAMNNIHLFVRDPQIRAKLKEVQGIGTEATQESVLSTLFERGYMEKRKKAIYPTELGRLLISVLGRGKSGVMIRPDMTALWENTMSDIQAGKASLESFVAEVAAMVREIISERLEIPAEIPSIKGMERLQKCLTEGCGGFLRNIKRPGKSAFFSCPLCHATFSDENGVPIPGKKPPGEIPEAPCPLDCGNSARRYEGRYGYFWKCDCSPGMTFKDVGGVPAVRETRAESACPVPGCEGRAARFTRKDGGYFWKCAKCGSFFDDVEGTPAVRAKNASKKFKKEKRN